MRVRVAIPDQPGNYEYKEVLAQEVPATFLSGSEVLARYRRLGGISPEQDRTNQGEGLQLDGGSVQLRAAQAEAERLGPVGQAGLARDARRSPEAPRRSHKWSYGVTCVPQRRSTLLGKTLASLAATGFDNPTLFVDGLPHDAVETWQGMFKNSFGFPLAVSNRYPQMKAVGNYILALWELLIREPSADRYVIFQDDIACVSNLRKYLDSVAIDKTYLNLFTFPKNQETAAGRTGFYPAIGKGLGALALVFDRDGLMTLLTHGHTARKPTLAGLQGIRSIDGWVYEALAGSGYREMVHNPSLVQHTGADVSAIGNKRHPLAISFPGEQADALQFLSAVKAIH